MGTVLDQVQKLFSRGFLISSFIPCCLFIIVIRFLWFGYSQLRETVEGVSKDGLAAGSFDVLAALVAIYLLSYVLYGIRAFIHGLFQGDWHIALPLKRSRSLTSLLPRNYRTVKMAFLPGVLNRLERLFNLPSEIGESWETDLSRVFKDEADVKASALDVPHWVLEKGFEQTFSITRLTPDEVVSMVEKLRAAHSEFARRVEGNEAWEEKEYWEILTVAQILRANRRYMPDEQKTALNVLIEEIKTLYNGSNQVVLREAVNRMREHADREWRESYTDYVNDFPEDERWLRPTRLGNIAMVQELRPLKRYGINLSAMWPRLAYVMTPDSRARVEEANIYLDFTVIMSLLSLISCGISIYTAFDSPPRQTVTKIILPILCFVSFWLFYRLAIQATRAFGAEVQAAVDMFRLKLLDSLEIERPNNPQEEKQIWTELRYFIAQGDLPQQYVRFKKPDSKSEQKPKSEEKAKGAKSFQLWE
jgi:hypothetical protein